MKNQQNRLNQEERKKEMKRKELLVFLLAAVMSFQPGLAAFAQTPADESDAIEAFDESTEILSRTYLTEERTYAGIDDRYSIPDSDVEYVKNLGSASVSVTFKTTSTGLMALAAVNSTTHANEYISLYISGGSRIGAEIRNQTSNTHNYVDVSGVNLSDGDWHTITFIVEKNVGYKFYLDGSLVKNVSSDSTQFTDTLGWTPTSLTFGGANRISGNSYPFTGTIKNAKLYLGAISTAQVMEDHSEVMSKEQPGYEEGVIKTDEYGIFDMGDYDAYNYRIPALVTTKNGTVIAAADQRNDHWSDWGNIDTVVRISSDKGQSWTDPMDVIDLKSQPYDTGTRSAFLIDPVMIATDSGRVWMMVDMFPESTGFGSIDGTGTGFVEVGGEKYQALYDASGNVYTIRGTEVYDVSGNKTDYTVDNGKWEDRYHTKGDLYDGDEYVGNIYLLSNNTNNDSAPLTIKKTCYLWLTYSDDNGQTWSNPVNISGQVKEEWMKFCGTGPGFGIELKNGEHKGRLIFPIYYTNNDGFQSSACIYSDDGGRTWTRGESPNDGRINSSDTATDSQNPSGIDQLTESQIIELNNGHLLQFMRNTGSGQGKVAVSRSTDSGVTWEDPYYTDAAEVYCQLSVLHYPETVDGKEIIIMSNPGGSGRNNGTLRIGEIAADDSITWVETKVFCPGNYAYSCLTYMGDGTLGLLYEHANTIKFTSFNLDYIKSDVNILSPTITDVSYSVEKTDDHKYVLPGDTYIFTVTVDQNVSVKGTPQFRFSLDGEAKYADFVSIGEDNRTLVFSYLVKEGDEGFINYRGPKIISDAENAVINASGMLVSANDMEVELGYIGEDPSDDSRDIPVSGMTATAGSAHSGEGADKTLDNNTETIWHTEWASGHNRDQHWISYDLGEEYQVDGIRYLPRQSGGINGIITGYKIQVSDDGQTFRDIAEGTWASDTSWKLTKFNAVVTRYIRLVVTDGLSLEAANDYASAAEIRFTGQEAPEIIPDTEKPSKPENVTVSQITAASAVITWSASTDNVGISKYVVTDAQGKAAEVEGNETSISLTDLTAGTSYTYTVAAYDESGNASDAAEVTFTTKEETPIDDNSEILKKLQDAVNNAVNNDEGKYTEESFGAYTEKLDTVKKALEDPESITEESGLALLTALEEAEKMLVLKDLPIMTAMPYIDVTEDQWFYNFVYDVYEKGLMTGKTETIFAPAENIARAQFALILYRMEGQPEVEYKNQFPDVKKDDWFANAVIWAYENEIITGYSDSGLFGPADDITREQMATMMFRYANYKKYNTAEEKALTDFPDGNKVNRFAKDAMEWCTAMGIISGKGEESKVLDPQGNTVRAEAATIISRYTDIYSE